MGRISLRIHSPLAREALAEFISTFILIMFGDGSVAQTVLSNGDLGTQLSINWSWGLGVAMGVYLAGGVSGAHMNPSVSFTLALLGKFSWKKLPVYIVAQFLGAFMAAAVLFGVYWDALNNFDGGVRQTTGPFATAGIFATYPQPYVTTASCFGDQVVGTAILLVCILAITDPKNMEPHKGIIPLLIGLVVFVIGMTFGLNCGYGINPARDLAPRTFTALAGWGAEPFSFRNYNYFWVPVVGPLIGAPVGAFLYQFMVGFHWPLDKAEEGFNEEEVSLNVDGAEVELNERHNADKSRLTKA
ncbi:aquaporin-9-like [Liolophura sinensis]|uniref:aquaporin-9-like n=1 Tax=Liolophura sinensis TaxID=3198878 RepID=UPI0031584ECC